MKNTYCLLRASFYAGILSKKVRAARLCRVDLLHSKNDEINHSQEKYFKELSATLHNENRVQNLVKSVYQDGQDSETLVMKDTNNVQSKIEEREATELYEDGDDEDESFDSLAEKEIKTEAVPKLIKASFNLAAYANNSETLQQLVKLGVDLSKWEKMPGVSDSIIKLGFEKDIKKYITFLHDIGVSTKEIGTFLTKNPNFLNERLDDMQVRINYLESKKFSPEAISRIVTKSPHFIMFSTQAIDRRLGYLQKEYQLSGDEIRSIITRQPKLAIWNFIKLRDVYFSVKEEMGFTSQEIKALLLNKPKIWLLEHRSLLERFNYIHLTMNIPHNLIVGFPGSLTRRRFQLKQRHLFLKSLNRDQFDPTKESYVSLKALCYGTDNEFCTNVAKTSVKAFNQFLKTL